MKRILAALIAACLALHASASWADAGTAENVRVARMQIVRSYGNFVFIHLNPAPSVRASCSTNSYWHFTLSLDDAAGKNMYAQLLSAFASGSLLNISGANACNEFTGVESVVGLGVNDGS